MNIIGTLDRPDSGDVIFRDRSITTLNADESADYRNRNIGFVFQDHLLLPHLTVHENIMLPLLAYSIDKEAYAAKESDAVKLMERIGIHDLKDKYPFQISGGEAQRVTLVRALINNPSLLLADEPTGSLDATNAEVLGKLLKELNEELGITLFVVTHSSGLASEMKIHLKLKDGKLVN